MRADKKLFFEKSFTEQELLELINTHISN